MNTTKLTLFSLISKGIALKILTLLFLVCNIQVMLLFFLCLAQVELALLLSLTLSL